MSKISLREIFQEITKIQNQSFQIDVNHYKIPFKRREEVIHTLDDVELQLKSILKIINSNEEWSEWKNEETAEDEER